MTRTHADYSRNERTSEESEQEGSLCRTQTSEGCGTQRTGNDGSRKSAEEEREDQRAGGQRQPAQLCRNDAEAHTPQHHPQDVGDNSHQQGNGADRRPEAPCGEERSSRQVEREPRASMSNAEPHEGAGRCGSPDETHSQSVSYPVSDHERKEEEELPTLKG